MNVLGTILKWVLRIGTLGLSLIGEKSVVKEWLRQGDQCRNCQSINTCTMVNQGYGCNQFKELNV